MVVLHAPVERSECRNLLEVSAVITRSPDPWAPSQSLWALSFRPASPRHTPPAHCLPSHIWRGPTASSPRAQAAHAALGNLFSVLLVGDGRVLPAGWEQRPRRGSKVWDLGGEGRDVLTCSAVTMIVDLPQPPPLLPIPGLNDTYDHHCYAHCHVLTYVPPPPNSRYSESESLQRQ